MQQDANIWQNLGSFASRAMFRSGQGCKLFNRSTFSTSPALQLIKKRYELDGFCFPLELFPEKVFRRDFVPRYETFRRQCLEQNRWSEYRFKSHLFLPWLHEMLVKNDFLKKTACALLATDDVVIWSTDWCVKPRSSEHHFTWHQDSTYSKFGHEGATLWLAFSRVRSTSGPLMFRKSSHLLGQLPHRESADESNLLAFGQYIESQEGGECGESEWTNWTSMETVEAELEPGQASAHSFLTIHSSSANTDDDDRVGLAVRIVQASAGVRRNDRVTHLCGNPQAFEIEAAPKIEFGSEELREWELSMEREKSMYFADRDQSNYK